MSFPTTSVLDTFTGAGPTSPPDGNWSQFAQDGAFSLQLTSNQVTSNNSTSRGGCYWNPATFGPDAEAYCTIATVPLNGQQICLSLRCSNPGTSVSGYRLLYQFATTNRWNIQRLDAGAGTTLASADTNDLANGDKIGFEAKGNILTGYRWNGTSWISVVSHDISGDATKYTGAGSIALSLDHQTVRADDFGGGTVVSATHFGPFTGELAMVEDIVVEWTATGGRMLLMGVG